ncbi:MAG TPA: hypothetical protein VFY77_06965, partial [Nitrososphaeraceae archaeon]|nr:hypothetical protein [Nitrososphaeraceae archaeon]
EHVIAKEQKEMNNDQKTDTNIKDTSKINEKKENKLEEEEEELEISMKHFESSFSKIAKKNKQPSAPRISSIA